MAKDVVRTIILTIIYLMLACLFACEKFDFDSVTNKEVPKELAKEYEDNFKQQFGYNGQCYIDPDHTWGFAQHVTRAANTNSNEWASYTTIPDPITSDEAEYVYNFFKERSKNTESLSVNWSEFFVQHVWKGKDSYTAADGTVYVGGEQMDHLYAADEHVNNFNNANGSIMLMEDAQSNDFSYYCSASSERRHEYKILYVPNYGYYIGFDFCGTGANGNQQIEPDGIYTDWIVKIVPGVSHNAIRVMCEDLGDTDDFDFNDLVFDVYYKYVYWSPNKPSGLYAIITLQAAGGTMPIYIENKEVHGLFGVGTSVMVNTGSVNKPIVIYRELVNSAYLEIKVENTIRAITYTLTAEKGKVPYKIAVPSSVDWSKERVMINTTYPKFNDWVSNQNNIFW